MGLTASAQHSVLVEYCAPLRLRGELRDVVTTFSAVEWQEDLPEAWFDVTSGLARGDCRARLRDDVAELMAWGVPRLLASPELDEDANDLRRQARSPRLVRWLRSPSRQLRRAEITLCDAPRDPEDEAALTLDCADQRTAPMWWSLARARR